MVQELFSYLDPHKKAYLTELDWVNLFSTDVYFNRIEDKFHWLDQMLQEVRAALAVNFKTFEEAFENFAGGSKAEIDQEKFGKALRRLFFARFSAGDIRAAWNKIAGGLGVIDRCLFKVLYPLQEQKRTCQTPSP